MNFARSGANWSTAVTCAFASRARTRMAEISFWSAGRRTRTPSFGRPPARSCRRKSRKEFLIYGMKGGDSEKLFLRTVELDAKTVQYELVYKHEPTGTTVFRNSIPAAAEQPPSAVDIVGWNSPTTDDSGTHLLGVSLTIGPMDNPAWQGIVSGGKQYHSPPRTRAPRSDIHARSGGGDSGRRRGCETPGPFCGRERPFDATRSQNSPARDVCDDTFRLE
jgi:hypothetical protein